MKVYRYNKSTHTNEVIFNIMEGTYTGKMMGERSITATIDFPARIDFQIGDFVEFDIANLLRGNGVEGGHGMEKFYIYTKPTVKKMATKLSSEKAFQHTVIFYPCQYELATVKMRDLIQEQSNGIIYTGYDEFSFYGGANTLLKRIIAVLNERFGTEGVPGKDFWTYFIADGINEDKNTSLEKFQFDFSNNSVMDALLKLNEADGINTKFFINERTIYVGYKCPYITGVDENNIQRTYPFEFKYGKTSHLPNDTNYGNLFTITKSNGQASPITRLYAYGSDRNLHRFYCADRIKSGRYVNKLMLPSFQNDGKTDYIDSEEGIQRFGIREGSKTFEKVYPSLRNFYYGNIRDIKYCIKMMGSGLESDADGTYDNGMTIVKSSVAKEQLERIHTQINSAASSVSFIYGGKEVTITKARATKLMTDGSVSLYASGTPTYQYPIARIQCYRVDELLDGNNEHTGLNKLTPCAPPVDLAVFCHATGKVVKCVLYSDKNGQTSVQRQLEADGKVPTRTYGGNDYIVGSCFAVHDDGYVCGHQHIKKSYPGLPDCDLRAAWFTDQDQISIYTEGVVDPDKEIYRNQVSIHQIHYTDDHWITDIFEFTDYEQVSFNRQGYSAYCWPRVNRYYPESKSDNVEVSAVVDVGPVYIEDTDLNRSEGQAQATFDLYLRDVGFKINEQTWFGDFVFIFDTPHINFLDGNLAGYSFELPKESDQNSTGTIYVPARLADGTENEEFFTMADNPAQARAAYNAGAFWRVVAKRSETDITNYWMPNVNINAKAGDHIVFLDIFMPDIYIRVAEQRLYKEAQKYLDANDDGDIQYSFDFDKVRPNVQPTFALQMREGAIMRVVDDDLEIGTMDDQKTLFDDKDGLVSSRSMLKQTTTVDTNIEIVNRDCNYIEAEEIDPAEYGSVEHDGVTKHYLRFKKSLEDSSVPFDIESGVSIRLYSPAKTQRTQGGGIEVLEWYVWNYKAFPTEIVQDGLYYRAYIDNLLSLDSHAANISSSSSKVYVGYSLRKTAVTTNYDESVLPVGSQRFCPANNLTEFKPNKYYEVIMDAMENDLVVEDSNGDRRMFALVNGLGDGEVFFRPEYTATVIAQNGRTTRYKFAFQLENGFNSAIDYYPAILYQSDGQTEAVHVRLWNIIERDDEQLGELNYVDLAMDSVTIKFHDNTREKNVSLQDGLEPERITDNPTEMIREIQATVKEESRATAWAQLMDRVADTEIAEQQNSNFYQSMVNAARMHYVELLNLKNNIFDPDGTCNEVFLQTMMLQVGADSMNYQLKYTYYNANGKRQNCDLVPGSSPATGSPDKFVIGNAEDRLDHFVYTDNPTNGEGGTWFLRPGQGEGYEWNLIAQIGENSEITWPTYFISIKCSRTDPRVAWWQCETTQRKVNEDDNYFYFNWGILAPDANGHYTLTETRGNAYMYGDNLICGRISTLARDSYFDLTHGDFVLSKNGAPALAYVNGTLTIYGVNDAVGIGKTIKDLGLQEIGGENLLYISSLSKVVSAQDPEGIYKYELTYYSDDTNPRTHTFLPAGKYVFSAKSLSSGVDEHDWMCRVHIEAINSSGIVKKSVQLNDGDIRDKLIEFTEPCYIVLQFEMWTHEEHTQSQGYVSISNMQLQQGTKSTAYQNYMEHLTNALKGTTEMAGGLVMTNVLMLKDENGAVKAGMSGLQGTSQNPERVLMWGGATYAGALNAADPDNDYHVGAGKTGNLIQTLLMKDGTGKIGIFRIGDEDVKIVTPNGVLIIDDDEGISIFDSDRVLRTFVTPLTISGVESAMSGFRKTLIAYTGNDDYKNQTFGISGNEFQQEDILPISLENNIVSDGFTHIVFDTYVRFYGYDQYIDISNLPVEVSLLLKKVGESTYTELAKDTITLYQYDSGGDTPNTDGILNCYKRLYVDELLEAGIYSLYLKYHFNTTLTEQILRDLLEVQVGLQLGNKEVWYTNSGRETYGYHITNNYVGRKVDKYTILGSDGFVSYYDSSKFFKVVNTQSGQQIIAKGLPTTKPDTSGQMWVDTSNGNVLKVH